jgi:uncharacterized protein
MKYALALSVMLFSALLAHAEVTVNGQGSVTYVPDVAHIHLGVVTDGSTAASAMDANNEAMRALFKRLAQLGIGDRDVQTTSFTITPRYRQVKDHEPELIGYTASNQLAVKVRKIDETGMVLDSLVKDGANRVNGVTFDISDPQKLLDEARQKAIADARHKADLYATGAGSHLGKVLRISEAGAELPPPRMYSLEQAKDAGVPLAKGEQKLSVSVTVVWDLSDLEK